MDTSVSETRAARGTAHLLAFRCGGHRLAVGVEHLREVVEPRPVTRVPDAPPWALGVMNVRGQVVPVVDLARRLRFAAVGAERPCVLLVDLPAREEGDPSCLGLEVEAVDEVLTVGLEAVEEPPSFGVPVHPDYLIGVVEDRGEALLLLDLPAVLSVDEVRQAVEAGGATRGDAGEANGSGR